MIHSTDLPSSPQSPPSPQQPPQPHSTHSTHFENFLSGLRESRDTKSNIDEQPLTFNTIKSALEAKHLRVKWYKNLFIVTYSKKETTGLDTTDPLVRECRGLIVNKNSPFDIVCKGFDMFEETTDIPEDILTRNDGRLSVSIDGSYIRIYFNVESDRWCVATNRCIEAKKARWQSYRTFYDYFQDASTNKDSFLDFSKLNKDHVYLFVMCHPENRIVRVHPNPMLYHIGTLDRSDNWTEIAEDIGLPTPPKVDKTFFCDVEKMKEHIDRLDWQAPGYVAQWTDEGGQNHRSKIRNAKYQHINSLRGSKSSIVEHYLDLRNDLDQKDRFIDFIKYYPEYALIEDTINMVVRSVHYQYMAYYINKTMQFVQDRTTWRLLNELHIRYIRTHQATTLDVVQQHIRSMPNADLAKLLQF